METILQYGIVLMILLGYVLGESTKDYLRFTAFLVWGFFISATMFLLGKIWLLGGYTKPELGLIHAQIIPFLFFLHLEIMIGVLFGCLRVKGDLKRPLGERGLAQCLLITMIVDFVITVMSVMWCYTTGQVKIGIYIYIPLTAGILLGSTLIGLHREFRKPRLSYAFVG